MKTFEDLQQAITALRQYERGLDAGTSTQLRDVLSAAAATLSPVDAIVNAGEALYANLANLDPEGQELCASLIAFATGLGWHGLASDGRGVGIVKAALRECGKAQPWSQQAKKDDPAVKPEFQETTVASEAEAQNEATEPLI